MKICCRKKWKYLFTHKGIRQKLPEESYEWIRAGKGSIQVRGIGNVKGDGEHINHVEETVGKEERANLFCYGYKTGDGR